MLENDNGMFNNSINQSYNEESVNISDLEELSHDFSK